MKKLVGEIDVPVSSEFAESILCYGMMQRRDVRLSNAKDVTVSEDLKDFSGKLGYSIDVDQDEIRISGDHEAFQTEEVYSARSISSFFRRMLILSRLDSRAPLEIPPETNGDFENQLIVYRRLGFDYDLLDSASPTQCAVRLKPAESIKYSLPLKNYHLVQALVEGAMTAGCSIEISSKHAVSFHPWATFPSIGIKVTELVEDQEEDELARRLRKLKLNKNAQRRYVIAVNESTGALEQVLPGDHVIALHLAALACMKRNSRVTMRGLPGVASITDAFRLFAKMGAEIDIRDDKSVDGFDAVTVAVSPGALTSRKFGGRTVRACPECFGPIAALAMFAEGKTVVRDLPFGSDMWRDRVGAVRQILQSCGARVGEIEDGLVVENGGELMMTEYLESDDPLLEYLQQSLSLALPHHSGYETPPHFENSHLFRLYKQLIG